MSPPKITSATSFPCTVALAILVGLGTTTLGGCSVKRNSDVQLAPELTTYLELVLPARIQVLSWTRPASIAGDGKADGMEVVLAAYDAADDETKLVGELHFELQTLKPSEQIGRRVAFWSVELTTARNMYTYLDRSLGFYRFPLELQAGALPPGSYRLNVQLQLPDGQRLFHEHEFNYDGAAVDPPPTT